LIVKVVIFGVELLKSEFWVSAVSEITSTIRIVTSVFRILQVRRATTEQAAAQRVAAAAEQVDALRAEAAQAADCAASEATSTAARVFALEERLRTERAAAEQQQAASAERQASLEAELHAATRQVSALELQRQAAASTAQQEAAQAAEQAAHVAAQQAAANAASAAEQLRLATGEVVSLRHQLLGAEELCGEHEHGLAAARQRLAELEEQVCSAVTLAHQQPHARLHGRP